MTNVPIIAPSILAANFGCLDQEITDIISAGADWVHLDVMDGHFVPNLSFGAPVISCLRPVTKAYFDAHLMVVNPDSLIPAMAEAGVNGITVHWEACTHLDRTLSLIAEHGCRAGVAVNPQTPVEFIQHVLDKVDLILVMTVNPGFGGQAFIPAMLDKIRLTKKLIEDRPIDIQVDGGITQQTASDALAAGASVLVAGSDIFKSDRQHYAERIENLRMV